MAAARWVRTCLGSVPERAERARRFCVLSSVKIVGARRDQSERLERIEHAFGSCKSSFSQCSAALIDRVGSHAVEGKSLADSGVRGVSISFFTYM